MASLPRFFLAWSAHCCSSTSSTAKASDALAHHFYFSQLVNGREVRLGKLQLETVFASDAGGEKRLLLLQQQQLASVLSGCGRNPSLCRRNSPLRVTDGDKN